MSDPTFALLAAARFAHFAAVCVLFGLAAFPAYAGAAPVALARALKASAWAALATALLALPAMAANIGGDVHLAFDVQTLGAVVTDTTLGKVWIAGIVLAMAVAVLASRPAANGPLLGASGLLLASVALTGHSALPGGALGVLHRLADAIHLLAAGWWIGGLTALALTARGLGHDAPRVLARFSGVGYCAVAAIGLTGLFKSALLLGSLKSVGSAYGLTLAAKVVLVGGMGALAMLNRSWIAPALARGGDGAVWLPRLQRSVVIELALGMAVLSVVGALGAMAPPIST